MKMGASKKSAALIQYITLYDTEYTVYGMWYVEHGIYELQEIRSPNIVYSISCRVYGILYVVYSTGYIGASKNQGP